MFILWYNATTFKEGTTIEYQSEIELYKSAYKKAFIHILPEAEFNDEALANMILDIIDPSHPFLGNVNTLIKKAEIDAINAVLNDADCVEHTTLEKVPLLIQEKRKVLDETKEESQEAILIKQIAKGMAVFHTMLTGYSLLTNGAIQDGWLILDMVDEAEIQKDTRHVFNSIPKSVFTTLFAKADISDKELTRLASDLATRMYFARSEGIVNGEKQIEIYASDKGFRSFALKFLKSKKDTVKAAITTFEGILFQLKSPTSA